MVARMANLKLPRIRFDWESEAAEQARELPPLTTRVDPTRYFSELLPNPFPKT